MTHYADSTAALGKNFYGRDRDVMRLSGEHSLGWKWLVSQRRMGKTSVLLRVQAAVESAGGAAPYLDLASMEQASSKELVACFYDLNAKLMKSAGLSAKTALTGRPTNDLGRIVDALLAKYSKVVILFDEAERLIQIQQNEAGFLTSLRGRLAGLPRFSFVLSSTQRLTQLFDREDKDVSSYFGQFSYYPLGGLNDEESEQLLSCAQTRGWKSKLTPAVVAEAVAWCGGHPLLLQKVGSHLAEETDFNGDKATLPTLHRIFRRIALEPGLRTTIADDYARLTDVQRALLDAACHSQHAIATDVLAERIGCSPDTLREAAAYLQHYGYLSSEEPWSLRLRFYPHLKPGASAPDPLTNASQLERARQANLRRRSLVLSYHSDDAEFVKQLTMALAPQLTHEHTFDMWDDRSIEPGMDLKQAFEQALNNAAMALLLVSPPFLAQKQPETQFLLTRAATSALTLRILYVRPSVVDNVTYKIQNKPRKLTEFQGLNESKTPLSSLSVDERERVVSRLATDIVTKLGQIG